MRFYDPVFGKANASSPPLLSVKGSFETKESCRIEILLKIFLETYGLNDLVRKFSQDSFKKIFIAILSFLHFLKDFKHKLRPHGFDFLSEAQCISLSFFNICVSKKH